MHPVDTQGASWLSQNSILLENQHIQYFSGKPHEKLDNRSDWVEQIKTVIREFRDTKFIWAEPHDDTIKFDMNNLTYDTYENIRRNICR